MRIRKIFSPIPMTLKYRIKQKKSDKNTEDILYFWKNNAIKYSKLAKVAKTVLSVPKTQFESERNFSSCIRTFEDRRSHLSRENVDKLLFIKSQLKDSICK